MKKIVSLSTLLVCCLCLAACNTSKSKKEVASEATTVLDRNFHHILGPSKPVDWSNLIFLTYRFHSL